MRIAIRSVLPSEHRVRFLGDRWTLTSGSAHAGYPVTNLVMDNLGFPLLTYGQRASQTWISGASDTASQDRTIGIIEIIGLLSRLTSSAPLAFGQWTPNTVRIRLDSFPLSDRIRPGFTISNLTNLTGASADLAGPVDPPVDPQPVGFSSSRLESVNPVLNTSFRATFTNHHATERTLTGAQMFRLHCADSTSASLLPSVGITVVPTSGSSFAVIAATFEDVAEGWILSFPWNASQLTAPTATVRIDVTGFTTGSSTVEFIDLEWVAELNLASAIAAGTSYDSGSLPVHLNSRVLPDIEIPANGTRYVHIEFSDFVAQVFSFPDTFEMLSVAGQLAVGRLIIAETVELAMKADSLSIKGGYDGESFFAADGSTRFDRRILKWSELSFEAEYVTADLAGDTLLHGLLLDCSPAVPLLFSFFDERPQDDVFAFVTGWSIEGGSVVSKPEGLRRVFNVQMDLRTASATAGLRG